MKDELGVCVASKKGYLRNENHMSKGVQTCNCTAYSRNLKGAISSGVGKLGCKDEGLSEEDGRLCFGIVGCSRQQKATTMF